MMPTTTAPATTTPTDVQDWMRWLGQQLDTVGTAAVEYHLAALAALARRRGVAAVACDVLADRTQPDVARHRAFARVVAAVATSDAVVAGALSAA